MREVSETDMGIMNEKKLEILVKMFEYSGEKSE